MSEDTSVSAKDNIDRSQVFAVYNVYRLVIGSVLFALTLSSTGSALVADEIPVQMLVRHPDRQQPYYRDLGSTFQAHLEKWHC